MAADGLGKLNGNYRVTPPQIQQWQGPDGSFGMSWNMSWEWSASSESQVRNDAQAVAAGGPDALSVPGSGIQSAMSLGGPPAAMEATLREQVAKLIESVKAILAKLGVSAPAGGGPGGASVPPAPGSAPGAASVPGGSVPGGSVPGAPGAGSTPPGTSAPPAGGGPGSDRERRDDGSKFRNIAQGVAGIIGSVFGGLSQLRGGGGGGGLFGGGPGLFGGGGRQGGMFGSPLTFDLDGDGRVSTTDVAGGRTFDLDGDGRADRTAWAGRGDGVLAFDADGDGTAGASGRELLGNFSDVDGDGRSDGHGNGFEALEALAVRHLGASSAADGRLDARELAALEAKAGLKMDVDGRQVSLRELGITAIDLGYAEAGANPDAAGNQHRQTGAGFIRDGRRGAVDDVWFKYE